MAAREQLSKDILAWSKGKGHMALVLPTSTGKSFNSFNIINNTYNGGDTILAVFPETPLIESFKQDCIKLGFEHLLENMTLICYASLHKYVDQDWKYVILDEGHHGVSDIRSDLISKLRAKYFILLSATLSEDNEDILFGILPFEKFYLSVSKAIERGILPEPEIIVKQIELDDEIVRNEMKYGKNVIKMTDLEYYQALSKSVTYWREKYQKEGQAFQRNKMLSEGSARARFLAKCKTDFARELIETLNERHIVFCGSLDQAKQLNGKQLVSSERSKKTNLKMIEDFNRGKTDSLFCKNMLREGINLVNCPVGIVIQLNNQEKDLIQQLGRCLRDSFPRLYILLVKDTVDDRFFNNSTASINEDYITFED